MVAVSLKKSFFQAEDGIRDAVVSRGLGDVYKRQLLKIAIDQITGDASSIDNYFQFREIPSPLDVLKERIIIDDNDIE